MSIRRLYAFEQAAAAQVFGSRLDCRRVRVGAQVQQLRHAFTHFKITLHAFECAAGRAQPRALRAAALRWVYPAALAQYPMGKVDRQIATWLVSGIE